MDKQTIQNIMQFMLRVTLSGQEVPAFNDAMDALYKELNKSSEKPHNKTTDNPESE